MDFTGIIILQYNNWNDTVNCINSILQYNTAPIKIIVVDNGSNNPEAVSGLSRYLEEKFPTENLLVSDNSISSSHEKLPKITFFSSSINDGYARGNNKGLTLAYRDPEIKYTLILNNDTLFVEDILPTLIKDIESNPDCAFITPLLYKADLKTLDRNCARRQTSFSYMLLYNFLIFRIPEFIKKRYFVNLKSNTGLHEAQLISGSCMFARKLTVEHLNGYDPNTFLYYEENILWEKVKRLGLTNSVDTNLRCVHLGGSSTRKLPSKTILGIMFQSQTFFATNFIKSSRLMRVLLRLSQRWVFFILSMKFRRK